MIDLILVVLYNSFFLGSLIGWIYLTRRGPLTIETMREKLRSIDARWFYLVSFVVIVAILVYQLSFGVHNTDVDDAISSATLAFLSGKNPYAELVTKHYPPTGGIVYSYYHYFPVDLLVHALIYIVVGHLFVTNFPTFWFVVGYLFLLPPTAWAFHQVIKLSPDRSILLFLILTLPFMWTNSLLTLVGFIWGLHAWEVRKQRGLGILIWIFSSSSKYITGVFVFFLFFFDLQKVFLTSRGAPRRLSQSFIRENLTTLAPYVIGSMLFILTWVPFGIWEVIRGVFLYQGSLSERSQIAEIKGPLLVEVLKVIGALDFYMPVFLILLVTSIVVVSWFYKGRPMHQFIMMSLILMLIFPFYGTELFCAPAAAMIIYLFRSKERESELW